MVFLFNYLIFGGLMDKLKVPLLIFVVCMFMGQANASISAYKHIEKQEEVILIMNIRAILLNTQQKVTMCLRDGTDNDACFCRFKKNYVYLDKITRSMFDNHPDWKLVRELNYYEAGDLKSIALQELQRQINIKFKCVYTELSFDIEFICSKIVRCLIL
jgi:hypothetical protein